MHTPAPLLRHRPARSRRGTGLPLCVLAAAALAACGGGGGGSAPAGPLSVSSGAALAGDPAGLAFRVALPAGSVGPASFDVTTASLGSGVGSATGGTTCGAGVDYISQSRTVQIPEDANSTSVVVQVCANTGFEPAEQFELVTSYRGGTARGVGTVLNTMPGGLNDTGMDQCLNAAGALVACSASDLQGQDGQTGRDAQALTNSAADGRAGLAYAARGTACIEDQVSGLVWDSAAPATASLAAAQARVAVANAAALCGFSDWRLPNVEELSSLVDNGAAAAPRIDARFAGTPAVAFWSDMLYAGDTAAAWLVDFNAGAVAYDNLANPAAKPFASRLVRGSNPATATPAACDDSADTRFTVNGNATVTDTRTGLVWQQCVEGQSGAACASGSPTAYPSFGAALLRAAAVNVDASGAGRGNSDWRVPNRNELASLVNRRCGAPTIVRHAFPNAPALSLWTSTPARNALVWYVDFTDGSIGPGGMNGGRALRLVRGG